MTLNPDRCCCDGDDDHGHLVGCPAVATRTWDILRLGPPVFIGLDLARGLDLTWRPHPEGLA